MERINYRITLDAHKSGIQRMLQGFETADDMARRISVNLVAGGDTYEIPQNNIAAVVYVTTPDSAEPSINDCTIEGDTIIYDVLPIAEAGITEMQIKLIETSMEGAKRVLLAPRFAVEVTESNADDESAEQTTTFTALENAIAKASGVYDTRLLNIEIGTDYVFRAYYADGRVYENAELYAVLSRLSESWAVGGTGVRVGEDTDNSMYYSEVSQLAAENASRVSGEAETTLEKANKALGEATNLLDEAKTFRPSVLIEKVESLEQDKLDADGGNLVGNTLGFNGDAIIGLRINANGTFTIGDLTDEYYGRDARRLGLYSNNTLQLYDLNGDAVYYFYGDTTRTSGSYSGTGAKRNVSVTTFYGQVQPQLVLVYGSLGMGFVTPNCGVWINNGSGSINCEYSTYFNGYEIVMAADSWFNSLNDPYFYTIVYT